MNIKFFSDIPYDKILGPPLVRVAPPLNQSETKPLDWLRDISATMPI
jgi:hypothetical protein